MPKPFKLPNEAEKLRRVVPPVGAAFALWLKDLACQLDRPLLLLARDNLSAHQLEDDLRAFLPSELPLLLFPDLETLAYEWFSPHPEIVAHRIDTLTRMPALKRGIVLSSMPTALQHLAPRSYICGQSLSLRKGQRLNLSHERARLDAAGFRLVDQVAEPGDYSVRGSLLDLYPIGSNEPYRIELFDVEIESIRTFDPETQRSTGQVTAIELKVAREMPFDEDSFKRVRETLIDRFDLDARRSALAIDLRQQRVPAGIEFYLPLFFDHTENLFDYFQSEPLVVMAEGSLESVGEFLGKVQARYESRAGDLERPILPVNELWQTEEELRRRLNGLLRIQCQIDGDYQSLESQPVPMLPLHQRHAEPGAELKRFLDHFSGRTLIAVDSAGRREALQQTLSENELKPVLLADFEAFRKGNERFAMAVLPLSQGFALKEPALAVLTEQQLLGERVKSERKRGVKRARDPAQIIADLNELSIGAPVVHADHGVGRFAGLVRLDIGGFEGEFLNIEYAGQDKLYVPVAALDLISRYTGGAPEHAPLHSLGSDAWEKAKRRAQAKVRDVAAELLEIYAKRQARPGHAVHFDRSAYAQFAASFPFEESHDQAQAIQAVIDDLVKPVPMDRVVCGDVGFGKTEVALRAAFVAAHGGKQVALLVPTTLLAQQHFRNFQDRFADWPIKVELLSRFQSGKETKASLERLADGRTDVVIGTHKLLSDGVRFKDLGLVIVDEEQRFGVRQKEQLKKLRAEVHLLTLTATPIPRTLNMSMAGLRDLSIIATPPKHRLAVKTIISTWDAALIKEAFQREMGRGGQVYVLHNEVETIERAKRELQELIPDARIGIAHGQLPKSELEQVMLDFYRQRINVLLCSTIIENGIDVPSANTIIIERADRFGLAQLHQLRGRVGRSHHRAFAYLITPDRRSMTGDAIKRLDALASLDELGAGFTLATHDLEIRGAGELLGEEQSGEISEVGFSLYTEMLEKAVSAIKQGKLPNFEDDQALHAELDLHLPALIPEDFLADVHARLTLYKRLASAADLDQLDQLRSEMIDRFGSLPEPALNLVKISELKLRARDLGIRKLAYGPQGGRIIFGGTPNIEPLKLVQLLQREAKSLRLEGQDKIRLMQAMADPQGRIRYISELLGKMAA